MDTHAEAGRFLRSLPHFARVQSATINAIAARCRLKSREAGQDLFLEGDRVSNHKTSGMCPDLEMV